MTDIREPPFPTHPDGMTRREFMGAGLAGSAAAIGARPADRSGAPRPRPWQAPAFALEEATIADLQAHMESGTMSAREITAAYLDRISILDRQGPALRHVIETNPDALDIAERLDRERRERGPRGPMHGIPVLVKDNIDTGDRMMTTAGSLALEGPPASRDAFVVDRLREAGAVVLGKANLSEWANFRSTQSSSGWSARGGQCRNPYALDRNPCGSSSGSGAAVSANLAAVTVGTETDGSVVCPAAVNGVVGVKPTVGLVSRSGIIPISHSQDTAGPMARTVRDAALLLGAMVGVDPRDQATGASAGQPAVDYVASLDPAGLRGARIGVMRRQYWTSSPEAAAIGERALDALRDAGAAVIDPADIPTAGDFGATEYDVMLYEFKDGLNRYLAERGPDLPVRSLADVIAFNERHADRELRYFGHEIMLLAEEKGPLTEQTYLDALAANHRMARDEGIDTVMSEHDLDALVAPTTSPAWTIDLINGDNYLGGSSQPAAVAGYPSITVPAGFTFGLPVGMTFIGRAWSEATLLRLAYAFEQTTNIRRAPTFRAQADWAG